MNKMKLVRIAAAITLIAASGAAGYTFANARNTYEGGASSPTTAIAAPEAETVRVIYSLDRKQNDKEIIALINGARDHIYFAIYTFTLPSIADALIKASERGVDVRGVMDSGQSTSSYGAPITEKLLSAGIPVVFERHATGNGIMHIKAIVTESAYAIGSYNWTSSATTINDEILEVGTGPALRQAYEDILKRLFDVYRNNPAAAQAAASLSIGVIDYTEAPEHIGETASVRGTLVKAYTSASGTVFIDFCKSYKTCPFSGVIFADDVLLFGDLSKYTGQTVILTGKISSYQGKAEIVLSDPSQLRAE